MEVQGLYEYQLKINDSVNERIDEAEAKVKEKEAAVARLEVKVVDSHETMASLQTQLAVTKEKLSSARAALEKAAETVPASQL